MTGRFVTVCLVLCLIPGLAAAEFYKYKDQNGIVRFTDNPLEVPKDQLQTVEAYTEIVTPVTADETRSTDGLKDMNARAETLNAERDLLAEEYAALEKEREALENDTRDPQDTAEYDSYKTQVDDYNAKIRAYEEKRKRFQEKVDAFNADVKNQ